MEIPDKTKFHPWKLHKIVLWKFQGQRWRPPSPLEISHDFFLVTLLEIPPNPLFGFFLFLLFSCPIETGGVHNNKQIRRNKQIQMDKELKEFNFKIPCTHTAQYNSIFSRNVDHPKIYLLFYSFRCPLRFQMFWTINCLTFVTASQVKKTESIRASYHLE